MRAAAQLVYPPAELNEVRDLTRYRMKTVQARTSEIQRLGKALESAGIKLGSVASSMTRDVLYGDDRGADQRGAPMAGAGGPGDRPDAVSGEAGDLSMALAGRFTEHHALLCRLHRDRIAVFDDAVDGLDKRITGNAARWERETGLLTSLPGFGDVVAQAWLGEIGPAPHLHFAACEKLASWVTLCPGNNISAASASTAAPGMPGLHP